ncbi:hypothetical protein [Ornithinimicrobium cerasi]|uniref:hypothetical protein n=1 Tax=Ornithinimicrobium cerasi TaxID=2248773 RepID=UPI0013793FC4|nr:hypothetical protein [Ornithinimicrobium cerasi]
MTTPQRLAVVVVALILGGLGAGAVSGGEPEEPVSASSAEAVEEPAATHPFLQDEVAFHVLPGVWELLLGVKTGDEDRTGVALERTQAHAVAVLDRPCDEEPILVGVPASIVGAAAQSEAEDAVDRGALRGVKTVEVSLIDVPVAEGRRLPACPVELTMQVPLGAAANGHLMASVPEPDADPPAEEAAATNDVLVAYSVTQFFSIGAYVLLALSALLVAVAGLLPLLIGASAQDRIGLLKEEVTDRKYPVFAAVTTALAAVSTGAVSWSDLVPSLHLGGVTVTVLLAGVLVTVGEAIVSATSAGWRFLVGHVLRVYGIAVLALLTPLILLHGSTIGWGGAVVWGVIVAVLTVIAPFLLLTTAPAGSGQTAGGADRSAV